MTSASGVPRIIQENLPPWLAAKPGTVEALWAGGVSAAFTASAILGAFYAAAETVGATTGCTTFPPYMAGVPSTPVDCSNLLAFARAFHWWWCLISVGVPAWRSHKAFTKASAATAVDTPKP